MKGNGLLLRNVLTEIYGGILIEDEAVLNSEEILEGRADPIFRSDLHADLAKSSIG